jgi:hypothetical protein
MKWCFLNSFDEIDAVINKQSLYVKIYRPAGFEPFSTSDLNCSKTSVISWILSQMCCFVDSPYIRPGLYCFPWLLFRWPDGYKIHHFHLTPRFFQAFLFWVSPGLQRAQPMIFRGRLDCVLPNRCLPDMSPAFRPTKKAFFKFRKK